MTGAVVSGSIAQPRKSTAFRVPGTTMELTSPNGGSPGAATLTVPHSMSWFVPWPKLMLYARDGLVPAGAGTVPANPWFVPWFGYRYFTSGRATSL